GSAWRVETRGFVRPWVLPSFVGVWSPQAVAGVPQLAAAPGRYEPTPNDADAAERVSEGMPPIRGMSCPLFRGQDGGHPRGTPPPARDSPARRQRERIARAMSRSVADPARARRGGGQLVAGHPSAPRGGGRPSGIERAARRAYA